jgi:hypothetical protein
MSLLGLRSGFALANSSGITLWSRQIAAEADLIAAVVERDSAFLRSGRANTASGFRRC